MLAVSRIILAAARLFVECADKGIKQAHYYVATVYKSGLYGYTRCDKTAYHHFLISAKIGDLRSQYFVAKQLFYGEGGRDKNHESAKQWLDIAISNGSSESKLFELMMVKNCLYSAIGYFCLQMPRVTCPVLFLMT